MSEKPNQTTKPAAVKAVETIEAFEDKYRPLINQKIKAGLRREQAINIIRAQIKENSKIAEAQLKACSPKA